MQFILIFVLNFCIINTAFSQTIIKGKITTNNNQTIAGANIVIVKQKQSAILAFAISGNDGEYELNYNGEFDSIFIKITTIGFATQTKIVLNKSQTLDFKLTEQATELPTVIVKTEAITIQGDTSTYNVASFSSKQDRVIGDVIAKLPGIEIDANGQIKYNGKPISNYYINGIDLLEQKYNIANNNIPSNLVDKVQVLDNHQPIKLLDSLRNSNTPALNIQLKKKATNKFIGKAKVSLGLTPLLFDHEIIAMQFNPKLQFISAYKYNNTGHALSGEMGNQVTIVDNAEPKKEDDKEKIVSLITLPTPPLREDRYRFNSNHLFHLSAIKILKNKVQFKFNIGYLNDYLQSNGINTTTFYLPTDTITLIENQQNNINTNKVNADIYYTINRQSKFVKNICKAQINFNTENGLIENTKIINQNLSNPFYQLNNEFLLLSVIRKKLIIFNSSTILNKTPQNLQIEPGQFATVFNQNLPYNRLIQTAALQKFSSNNSIAFSTKIRNIQPEFNIGTEYISKNLSSYLVKDNVKLNDSFQNNLHWQNIRLFAKANTIFKKNKTQFVLSFPVELNNISTGNNISNTTLIKKYFFFNPNFNLAFPINSNYTFEMGYSLRNNIGNFTQTTDGFILNNYRSINRNDSILPLQKTNNILTSLEYKNPLKAIFVNFSLSYSIVNSNVLYTQTFTNSFLQQNAALINNNQKSLIVSGRLNKYFLQNKTNITLSTSYTQNKMIQIQQNEFVNSTNNSLSFGTKIICNKLSFLSIENNNTFNVFTTKLESNNISDLRFYTSQLQNNLRLYFFVSGKTTFYINAECYSYWNKQISKNQYFFGDFGFKYKVKKAEWEIAVNNITNNEKYTTIILNNNLKQITNIEIRPTFLIAKCYFNF